MHLIPAMRKMRTRNVKLRVSSLALIGFIATFFFCCLCGTEAADAGSQSDSCCSSHHEAPVSEPCGSDMPGELCCETDPSGYLLQDAAPVLQLDAPTVILFVADYIVAESTVLFSSAPELRAVGYCPPPYLRFHSFLI
jgi:hypothetical protein